MSFEGSVFELVEGRNNGRGRITTKHSVDNKQYFVVTPGNLSINIRHPVKPCTQFVQGKSFIQCCYVAYVDLYNQWKSCRDDVGSFSNWYSIWSPSLPSPLFDRTE